MNSSGKYSSAFDLNTFIIEKKPSHKPVDFFEVKYQPTNSQNIIGHNNQAIVEQLKEYISNVNNKVVFIHGPTGCGKGLITELVIAEMNFQPIFFDMNDTHKKKQFIERIDCLLHLHTHKKTVLIIKNIDNALGETTFSQFLKTIKKRGTPIPVFLISSSRKLQKSYHKSMVTFIMMSYPDTESVIAYCKHICEMEYININLHALRYIVTYYECHIRKILQILKLLSFKSNKTKTFLLNDVKDVLNISKSDHFYNSAEFIYEVLMGSVFTCATIDSCLDHHPFVLDLFYSNLGYISNLYTFSHIIDSLGYADRCEMYMFKTHIWTLKHYSIFVSLLTFLILRPKPKKKYTMKKNMLNNLPSMIIKHRNCEFPDIPTRFKLKYHEYKYIDNYIMNTDGT